MITSLSGMFVAWKTNGLRLRLNLKLDTPRCTSMLDRPRLLRWWRNHDVTKNVSLRKNKKSSSLIS